MLRAAGALAILLASLSLGLNELRERRRHLESLRRLCSALSLLEAELGTNGNPLADVFRELRLRSEDEARRFFSLLSEAFVLLDKMSFPEIWREAALRCFPDLTSTETAELLHLGSVLGKYELSPKLEMKYSPRKIAVPDAGGEAAEEITVRLHHLDTNQHMNNAQYVHFAVMYLPAEAEIRELRVEYKKQAMLGDHIKPVIYHTADDVVLVSMNGEDGKPYAVVEMTLLKEGKL